MTGYRPQFEAGLRLFAQISEAMAARGLRRPILVGGAAVEFYTQSAISTGDFDLCTFRQEELGEEMMRLGFVRPSRQGQLLRGWVHPDLQMGFEVVAETPMDGAFDPATLVLVDTPDSGAFVIISVEDLIADRMAQYASGSAPDRLEQGRSLFALQNSLDRDYLDKRIRHETGGDYGIEALEN